MKQKHKRNSQASRERLVRAGGKLFAARGPDAATVAMIAREARINSRMVYHYFGSKEGLYEAVIRRAYEQISSSEVEFAHVLLPAEELLKTMVTAYYDFLAAHPEVVRLLTWENLRQGKATAKMEMTSFKAPIIEALRIALARGKAEGRFRKDVDEKQLLISCMALSFFYFSNQHTLSHGLGFDLMNERAVGKRIKHVVALILKGIRVNGSTPRTKSASRRPR